MAKRVKKKVRSSQKESEQIERQWGLVYQMALKSVSDDWKDGRFMKLAKAPRPVKRKVS